MNSREIRQSFLDFFAERGHRPWPSAPLVPHGDPTLLFTNAGMVQFKDYFLGRDRPPSRRAVSAQKCLRVSGKHNDLENVGPSPRHHTFFEMLGNFSFGDYFKEEAIAFGWELVTRVWGLPVDRLSVSVFEEDDEAAELWRRLSGLPPERIHRSGHKDNFWAMGETGPCGPCSEIFIDMDPRLPEVAWDEGTESGRYLELWNLVFMQFERDESGVMTPLPNPSIDTGAGLERVAAVLQGVRSNYDSDLFQPILAAAAGLAGTTYGKDAEHDVSLRVIADHLRAVGFLLADGVIPANEGRGYVLRRLLRRSVRHGMRLGFEEPFLNKLLAVLSEVMGDAYPELRHAEEASRRTVHGEEEKYLSTVATASRQVQEAVDAVRHGGGQVLGGEAIFRLYDTYGLPLELIEEIAEEERLHLDRQGFERQLEAQRSRSRQAGGDSQKRLAAAFEAARGEALPATVFEGYERLTSDDCSILSLARTSEAGAQAVKRLEAGESGVVVLDRTPFYAESGGQVGDQGELHWRWGRAAVSDTQKDGAGLYFHVVRVELGHLAVGAEVEARVDRVLRASTQRNHTATHLLHAALRRVLGSSVRQAGSLVAPDRLRFDFTHGHPLTAEELERVEGLVNRWVMTARDTVITQGRAYDEAVAAGAMALFGEKYGERVRTVEVPPVDDPGEGSVASLELCGGCHVRNIGEIGVVVVLSERGIAAGVRRIEALTGAAALDWVHRRRELLDALAQRLGAPPERLAEEVGSLLERGRELERELSRLRLELVSGGAEAADEVVVEGIKMLAREVPPAPPQEIRTMADVLRARLGSGVVVLGSREGEKVTLVAAVSEDLAGRIHAGELVKRLALVVGGGGGGRGDFAQAGGRIPGKLPQALATAAQAVREQIAETAVGG